VEWATFQAVPGLTERGLKVLGGKNVDFEMQIFFEKIWRQLVKHFFKVEAKKSKISDKISSRLDVLKKDGIKKLVVK
jgi:hypothetical protein